MGMTFEEWLFTIFDQKDFENSGFKAAVSFYGRERIEGIYQKWKSQKGVKKNPYLEAKNAWIEKSKKMGEMVRDVFGETKLTVFDESGGELATFNFT